MAYQRILQLTYVEDLLAAMKRLFVQYFEPFVTAFIASLHSLTTLTSPSSFPDFSKAFEKWDMLFDKLLKGLEEKAAQVPLSFADRVYLIVIMAHPGSQISFTLKHSHNN